MELRFCTRWKLNQNANRRKHLIQSFSPGKNANDVNDKFLVAIRATSFCWAAISIEIRHNDQNHSLQNAPSSEPKIRRNSIRSKDTAEKKKRMKNVSSYKREWERFKRKNVTLRWSFPWSWDQDLERDMSCLMRQEKASLNTRYGEFFAEITDNVHSHPSGYNFECRRETAITFTFYHFHRVESRRSRMCGRHFGLEGEIEREKER